MPEPTTNVTDFTPAVEPQNSFPERAVDTLLDVFERTTSSEALRAQDALQGRIVSSLSSLPARVPPPLNITEVGGYLNLLREEGKKEMVAQAIAAALGLADPEARGEEIAAAAATGPSLFLREIEIPRRGLGDAAPSTPLVVGVRSDFARALTEVMGRIEDRGGALPLAGPLPSLPRKHSGRQEIIEPLSVLGRHLIIAPAAILHDPVGDVLALARPVEDGAPVGDARLVARVSNPAAPLALDMEAGDWSAFALAIDSDGTVAEAEVTGFYFDIEPLLAEAGWYYDGPRSAADIDPARPLVRLENVTGLIPGQTRLGDELRLLYPEEAIAASALESRIHDVWNGVSFDS